MFISRRLIRTSHVIAGVYFFATNYTDYTNFIRVNSCISGIN
jgi:hypothetical protein